jgi:acyl transferase domain-containing protein
LDAHSVDPRERFNRYGIDSFTATSLLAELSGVLERSLSPTLIWRYPTIEELSRYLGGEAQARPPRETPRSRRPGAGEPIAVVGMACRFPRAKSPDELWDLLAGGIDAITEVPPGRWDVDALYDRDPGAPGKVSTRWGGFLDAVDGFDPLFFGISPREAAQMDPQQRLMLELSWESLDDAGIPPRSLEGSRTGVFFGAMWTDYARLSAGSLEAINQHTATGQDLSIIPARVSNTLGLRGPSLAINTACSSSLVAVHYARQSLLLGESTLALAGGVNLLIAPDSSIAMSKFGAMALDGRCKAFDARANGYVRGEGGGVVVLKPLHRALADGDRVRCILLGSAVNNDGPSNGLTAPSPRAQELVLEDACASGGVEPSAVHYVEAHGTGTVLGDPIEAGALGAVYGEGRAESRPLRVGSIKTNIGHLESAAGIAGLIKAILSLERRAVPPNLHFESPNPYIPLDALKLKVPTALEPWPEDDERVIAGVSSFGFGGTNCHVLLERLSDVDEGRLGASRGAREVSGGVVGEVDPVLVFAGQGSQWLHMGVDLLCEPAFRATLARCDEIMAPWLGRSLLDMLLSDDPGWLEDTALVQPAIFSVQVGLAALFSASGVKPAAVIGQSMGELAAAAVAGCLDIEDAARIVCARSRLVRRAAGRGAMAIIEMSREEAGRALAGREDLLSIAVTSSPGSTVISGDPGALHELLATLERRGVQCRTIKVDYASHCPQMDPLLPDLFAAIEGVRPRRGAVPFQSTVAGDRLDGRALNAAYWCKNLREPVLFAEAMASLVREGRRVFLDIGPHPLLVRAVQQCLDHAGRPGIVLPSMQRGEPGRAALRATLDALSARGLVSGPSASGRSLDKEVLLPISAHCSAALADAASAMARFLQTDRQTDRPFALPDLAHTLGAHRSHHEHRVAVVGSSREELAAALQELARGEATSAHRGRAPADRPRVVFVFPGQGSQWLGMGRTLFREEPVFGAAIEACDKAIRREAGFSIEDELFADDSSSRLSRIDIVQPTLFAFATALAALFRSWRIEPSAVVGHSMGEIAAAHVAGALSLEDAAKIVCRRSSLLRRVSRRGAMALVELTIEQAREVIAGREDRLSIAASNGPRGTVLSGDTEVIELVLSKLQQASIFCRRINVDVASHSPEVDPILGDLRAQLIDIAPKRAALPFYSTVTQAPCLGPELVADYWARNLREPVMFGPTIASLAGAGYTLFVEISPHPILVPAVVEVLRARSIEGCVAIASLRRAKEERRSILESLAALYVHGCDIDFRRMNPLAGRVAGLPAYPWQRRRCWIDLPERAERHVPNANAAPSPKPPPPDALSRPPRERVLRAGDDGQRLIAESIGRHLRLVLRRRDEPIPAETPLRALGLDSLMAMELRNRVQSDFQVELSTSRFLMARGINELALEVLDRIRAFAPAEDAARFIDDMEMGSI